MLEFVKYKDIDLNNSPIVVLSCSHFFTAETLDDTMSFSSVYNIDDKGNCVSLKEESARHLEVVPTCPKCKTRIKQSVTKRYNRDINQAVLDEMSRRYLIASRENIATIEKQNQQPGNKPGLFMDTVLAQLRSNSSSRFTDARKLLTAHFRQGGDLMKKVEAFRRDEEQRNAPARKVQQAIAAAARRNQSIDEDLGTLNLNPAKLDGQMDLSEQCVEVRLRSIVLLDAMRVFRYAKNHEDELSSYSHVAEEYSNCVKPRSS